MIPEYGHLESSESKALYIVAKLSAVANVQLFIVFMPIV